MQYKATLLLGLALVLGGMAAYMVKTAVNQPTGTPEGPAALAVKPVVVAAADLPSGTLLERAHLKVVDFTEASFPEGSYATIDELLDSETPPVVIVGLSANEVVLPVKLSIGVVRRGLTTKIPDGLRAVAIPVNDVRGVGGFVLPGDKVDVLHTTTVGRRDEQPVSRTLMQGITVLGVDQNSEENAEDPLVVKVVTLLVNPQQAKTLTLSQQVGHLTLSLRNEGDVAQESSATVALSDLWNFDPQEKMLATPMPVRPARSRNVQVIRGLEVIEERVSSKGDTTLAAVTAD
jgi:pilus assembly protein CpaB